MSRPLVIEGYPGISFPMEQFVGKGAGDAGHGGAYGWNAAPTDSISAYIDWNKWKDGTAVFQLVGSSSVAALGALSRALPMRHPLPGFQTYLCENVSNPMPVKPVPPYINRGAPPGSPTAFGPFPEYERIRVSLGYGVPPWAAVDDKTLATVYAFGNGSIQACNLTKGSPIVTGQGIAAGLSVGQLVVSTQLVPSIPGTNLFPPQAPTTILSINDANTIILSQNALLTGIAANTALKFIGNTGLEQFRYCWWDDDPQLQIETRDGFEFNYIEVAGLNGQVGGPPQTGTDPITKQPTGDSFKGFIAVPKNVKLVMCDWRFLPLGFLRNGRLNPANLDACLGKVNLTSFSTPKGTFLPGTCELKHYKIGYEISPFQVPGQSLWQLQVYERVKLIFEVFDTTTLKNPTIQNPVQGYNTGWYPADGLWYAIQARSIGTTTGTPPLKSMDFQVIFQQAQ